MQEFIDKLKAANDRIGPDERLVQSVLKAAEAPAPEDATAANARTPRFRAVSRRGFCAAAAAAALAAVGLGALHVAPALASTRLARPRIVLRDGYVDSVGFEDGRVVVGIRADFSCVDAADRDVAVSVPESGPLALEYEDGTGGDRLEFPAGGSMRGTILIGTDATDEERELLLDGDQPMQYRKLYECLVAADGAEIVVEAEGLRPTAYELRTSHIESWRHLRRKDTVGDFLYIDLVKS